MSKKEHFMWLARLFARCGSISIGGYLKNAERYEDIDPVFQGKLDNIFSAYTDMHE